MLIRRDGFFCNIRGEAWNKWRIKNADGKQSRIPRLKASDYISNTFHETAECLSGESLSFAVYGISKGS